MSIKVGAPIPKVHTGPLDPQPRKLAEKLGDSRANAIPCPVISTLLNESLLTPDKDGNVSISQLKDALKSVGMGPLVTLGLAHGGASAVMGSASAKALNVYKLVDSTLQHKGSLGPLQDGGFNQQLLDQLLSCSSDGKTLTLKDLATAQSIRMTQEGGGTRDRALGRAEISALLLAFGTPNAAGQKSLKLDDVVSIFKDNKLPKHFEKQDVGLLPVVWGLAKLAFLQNTTAAGRAEMGLRLALEQSVQLDASAMKGLGAFCPAGMRPKAGMGVSEKEVGNLHSALQN